MVQVQEIELSVGDVFRVGETMVTVIDIDGDEVTFRVDDDDSLDCVPSNGCLDSAPAPR